MAADAGARTGREDALPLTGRRVEAKDVARFRILLDLPVIEGPEDALGAERDGDGSAAHDLLATFGDPVDLDFDLRAAGAVGDGSPGGVRNAPARAEGAAVVDREAAHPRERCAKLDAEGIAFTFARIPLHLGRADVVRHPRAIERVEDRGARERLVHLRKLLETALEMWVLGAREGEFDPHADDRARLSAVVAGRDDLDLSARASGGGEGAVLVDRAEAIVAERPALGRDLDVALDDRAGEGAQGDARRRAVDAQELGLGRVEDEERVVGVIAGVRRPRWGAVTRDEREEKPRRQ